MQSENTLQVVGGALEVMLSHYALNPLRVCPVGVLGEPRRASEGPSIVPQVHISHQLNPEGFNVNAPSEERSESASVPSCIEDNWNDGWMGGEQ